MISALSSPRLWYRDKTSLKIGEVNRYTIRYKAQDETISKIYFRLKNIEKTGIRTVHLISGPFILYCHVIPCNYNSRRKFKASNPKENAEVVFENQIKPNQAFNATLLLNENSLFETKVEDGKELKFYQWEIDVVSQIVITKKTRVDYDLMIGEDLEYMKRLRYNAIEKTLTSIASPNHAEEEEGKRSKGEYLGKEKNLKMKMEMEMELEIHSDLKYTKNHVFNPQLTVVKKDTNEIWNRPPPSPLKPVHLVIVTHGIFSNLTADMLYLKDVLEEKVKENIMVRGFRYNAGRTEKGVKKLGINVALYIIDLIENPPYKFDKISFIAHSLGGVVQLYAIKYILVTKGVDFFKKANIEPANFTTLASPFLGIMNELNFVLSWALDLGTLGRTGRDLTLLKRLPAWKDVELGDHHKKKDSIKPILETLPDDPLQTFLGEFQKLTIYANAINDGIVPLRTAALLYLDYEALGDVNELKRTNHVAEHPELEDKHHDVQSIESNETVLEVPDDRGQTDDEGAENENENASENENENESTSEIESEDDGNKTKRNNKGNTKLKETLQHAQVEHSKVLEKHHLKFAASKYLEFFSLSSPTKLKMADRQKRYKNFTIKGTDTDEIGNQAPPNGSHNLDKGKVKDRDNDKDKVQNKDNNVKEKDKSGSGSTKDEQLSLVIPPRASAIESAINTLICPIPSQEYIMNPALRHPVIFHDRYYHLDKTAESENGDGNDNKRGGWFYERFIKYRGKWKLHKQVLIANKYHTKNLTWRKVLVNLPPDAHNNIVVRRRFANGYGWGVINHLCENLFDCEESEEEAINDDMGDNGEVATQPDELKAKI